MVSPLTYGTWGIGGAGWDDYPDDVRLDAIMAAVDTGINLIDTAPAYNGGRSEQYIGEALEQTGRRKDVLMRDNTDTIRWAHEQGMGIMAYGTLCGGLLTGRYRQHCEYDTMDNRNRFYGRFFMEPAFSRAMELLDLMQPAADAHDAALAEVAINWSRQKPFVDTCLVGAQKRARVEGNARALSWTLTAEEMAVLDTWEL